MDKRQHRMVIPERRVINEVNSMITTVYWLEKSFKPQHREGYSRGNGSS